MENHNCAERAANAYDKGWRDGAGVVVQSTIDAVNKLKTDSQVPGKHTEFVTYTKVIELIRGIGAKNGI